MFSMFQEIKQGPENKNEQQRLCKIAKPVLKRNPKEHLEIKTRNLEIKTSRNGN